MLKREADRKLGESAAALRKRKLKSAQTSLSIIAINRRKEGFIGKLRDELLKQIMFTLLYNMR